MPRIKISVDNVTQKAKRVDIWILTIFKNFIKHHITNYTNNLFIFSSYFSHGPRKVFKNHFANSCRTGTH